MINLFKLPIGLNLNGDTSFSTSYGVNATFLFVFIFALICSYFFYEIASIRNPTVVQIEQSLESYPPFDLNPKQIVFAFGFQNYNTWNAELDDEIVTIHMKLYQSYFKQVDGQPLLTMENEQFPMETCTEQHFKNDSLDDIWVQTLPLDMIYCFPLDKKKMIGGNLDYEENYNVAISIKRCDSIPGQQCKDKAIIDEFVYQQYLIIYYSQAIVNPLEDPPVKNKGQSTYIPFSESHPKEVEYIITPTLVQFQGVFSEILLTYQGFSSEYPRVMDVNLQDSLMELAISVGLQQKIMRIKYKSILEVLSLIGGLGSIVFQVFTLFLAPFLMIDFQVKLINKNIILEDNTNVNDLNLSTKAEMLDQINKQNQNRKKKHKNSPHPSVPHPHPPQQGEHTVPTNLISNAINLELKEMKSEKNEQRQKNKSLFYINQQFKEDEIDEKPQITMEQLKYFSDDGNKRCETKSDLESNRLQTVNEQYPDVFTPENQNTENSLMSKRYFISEAISKEHQLMLIDQEHQQQNHVIYQNTPKMGHVLRKNVNDLVSKMKFLNFTEGNLRARHSFYAAEKLLDSKMLQPKLQLKLSPIEKLICYFGIQSSRKNIKIFNFSKQIIQEDLDIENIIKICDQASQNLNMIYNRDQLQLFNLLHQKRVCFDKEADNIFVKNKAHRKKLKEADLVFNDQTRQIEGVDILKSKIRDSFVSFCQIYNDILSNEKEQFQEFLDIKIISNLDPMIQQVYYSQFKEYYRK